MLPAKRLLFLLFFSGLPNDKNIPNQRPVLYLTNVNTCSRYFRMLSSFRRLKILLCVILTRATTAGSQCSAMAVCEGT